MKYIYLLSLVLLFASCSKDSELTSSIKVPDPDNPELPAYSEWGYNTFGAIFERDVFTYSNSDIPLKVIVQDEHITFFFQGMRGNYDYMSLKFILPESSVDKYQDLMNYSNTIVDLNDPDVVVEMSINGTTTVLDIIEGNINFVRAQQLYIDKVEEGLILSGRFMLKYLSDGVPYSLSDGRFDFGIDNSIFYVL